MKYGLLNSHVMFYVLTKQSIYYVFNIILQKLDTKFIVYAKYFYLENRI